MKRHRYAFALIAIFTTAALWAGIQVCRAAETRVVMKDGRLFIGSIFPTKSVAETSEQRVERDSSPVQSDKILPATSRPRMIISIEVLDRLQSHQ